MYSDYANYWRARPQTSDLSFRSSAAFWGEALPKPTAETIREIVAGHEAWMGTGLDDIHPRSWLWISIDGVETFIDAMVLGYQIAYAGVEMVTPLCIFRLKPKGGHRRVNLLTFAARIGEARRIDAAREWKHGNDRWYSGEAARVAPKCAPPPRPV